VEVLPALAAAEMVLAKTSPAAIQQWLSSHPALAADLPFDPLWKTWLMALARRYCTQHHTRLGVGQQRKTFAGQGADQGWARTLPAQAEDEPPPDRVIRA
jgi:hypothetical protein